MALKVYWTEEAVQSFKSIVEFIEVNWTDREVRNFVQRTKAFIARIEKLPYMYKAVNVEAVREGVLSRQTVISYIVLEDRIDLLWFWDVRQDPANKPY